MAFGDHRLPELQTLIDDHVLVHADAGGHGTRLDRTVLFHYVDELAILAGLHGLVRHNQGIGMGRELERDPDELTRPELAVLIGEGSFQLDGSGSGIHGVVDEREVACLLLRLIVLGTHEDGELSHGHVFLDIPQLRFRNGEGDVNGLHLVDGHQVHVVCRDHVPLLDHEVAGAPVDGRADFRISQLELVGLDHRLGGHHLGLSALDGGSVGAHGLGLGVGIGAHLLALLSGNHALLR